MRNGKIQIVLNIFIILLFFVALNGCQRVVQKPQKKDVVVLYSDDSTIVLAVGLKDNLGKQGEWLFFDERGLIKTISNFKNDTLNGLVREFSCCRKFMEYNIYDGVFIDKITYYSPEGDISGVTYLDSLKSGYELKIYEGKLFQIDLLDSLNNVNSIFSDTSVDASDLYNDSSECCNY